MKRPLKIAVVGGGISGLTTAWFIEQQLREGPLTDQPIEIDLLESSDRLGGKIHTTRHDGFVFEMGAESFLSRKPHGMALCKSLGILDRLQGTRPETKKTFVWWNEKMHPLPEGLSGFVPAKLQALLKTSLLSMPAKARFLLEYLLPARRSRHSESGQVDDESIASFITRRLGKQTYERLVQPLLCGIYCGDGDQLSLNAAYPELRKLEIEHGSLLRGLKNKRPNPSQEDWPAFVTFAGGMSELIDSVEQNLRLTHLKHLAPVVSIVPDSAAYRIAVSSSSGQIEHSEFDVVIVTTSSKIAAPMFATSPGLSMELDAIPHVSTIAVNLWYASDELDHDLDGYGFVIPSGQQRGMTAVTWTSSKHFHRAPAAFKTLRVYLGRAGHEADPQTSDEQILENVAQELKRTMKIEAKPAGYHIQRWFEGSPQYCLGHLDRLKRIDEHLAELPGIFLTGSSYRGVGIPDCIRQGEQAAHQATNHLIEKIARNQ